MDSFPTLETERLRLRCFELSDAPYVQVLLNDPEVIGTMIDLSLPFSLADAQTMIANGHRAFQEGSAYVFAITRRSNGDLVGYADIEVQAAHRRGEIAYWIGKPYWWQGYATEAAKAIIRFGFEDLGLNRIYAFVLTRNTASAHVLQKAGLTHEGTLRHSVRKNDVFENVDFYGLLRQDWLTGR